MLSVLLKQCKLCLTVYKKKKNLKTDFENILNNMLNKKYNS